MSSYLTEIFYVLREKRKYSLKLKENTQIPAIYISDCLEATFRLIKCARQYRKGCVYNLGGLSITPKDYSVEVEKLIKDVTIDYKIDDFR